MKKLLIILFVMSCFLAGCSSKPPKEAKFKPGTVVEDNLWHSEAMVTSNRWCVGDCKMNDKKHTPRWECLIIHKWNAESSFWPEDCLTAKSNFK